MSGKHLLLPEARAFYDTLQGQPHITTMSPDQLRAIWRKEAPEFSLPHSVDKVFDTSAVGQDSEVPLRVYQPKGSGPFPICVYIHGGGFVGGDLEDHASVAAHYCSVLEAVVVAVHYRLAPEHPFPAAVDDCWIAVSWAHSHAEELQGDAKKLVVAGESAGGNLATVMCLVSKEHQRLGMIKAQICVSPLYDAANLDRPSYREFKEDEYEDAASIKWFLDRYVPEGVDPQHPHISPMYVKDLKGLPPAFILPAEVDVLRDEAEDFAEMLKAAGVRVKCKRYKGHFHNSMIDVDMFGEAALDVFREIKEFVDTVI